jgi:hypothetical protein
VPELTVLTLVQAVAVDCSAMEPTTWLHMEGPPFSQGVSAAHSMAQDPLVVLAVVAARNTPHTLVPVVVADTPVVVVELVLHLVEVEVLITPELIN